MGKSLGSESLLKCMEENDIDKKWPLVERQEIIDFFNREIKLNGPLPGEHRCFQLKGIGGIGKSFLCEKYYNDYLDDNIKFIYYDFESHRGDYTIGNILLSWVKLISYKEKKTNFNHFVLAYNRYATIYNHQQIFSHDLIKDNGFVNFSLDILSALNGVASAFVKAVGKVGKKISESLDQFKKQLDNCNNPIEIEKILIYSFCKDMEENLDYGIIGDRYPFIFYLDSYETYESNKKIYARKDEWLMDIINALPNCIWIICGREKLLWDKVEIDKIFELEAIRSSEAFEEIFKNANIKDENVKNKIKQISGGNPYHIQLLTKDYIKNNNICEVTNNRSVAERMLRGLDDNTRKTAFALSFLYDWGEDDQYRDEYLDFLKLSYESVVTLKELGIIKKEHNRHLYTCLQEAADINLVASINIFFEKRKNNNDNYSRIIYFQTLKMLWENNQADYQDKIEENVEEWLDMIIHKQFRALEIEFFTFFELIDENNILYIPLLYVFRIYLENVEKKTELKESISSSREEKMFRYIKEHKEYTYDLAKNYIYASEFVHALTVLEYIDEIYPFKSLNENDKLDRLSLWTFYFNSKGASCII